VPFLQFHTSFEDKFILNALTLIHILLFAMFSVYIFLCFDYDFFMVWLMLLLGEASCRADGWGSRARLRGQMERLTVNSNSFWLSFHNLVHKVFTIKEK